MASTAETGEDVADRVASGMHRAYELKLFAEAPPKFPGFAYPWRYRKEVEGREAWCNSVYYYWWEYIRRNARYRLICDVLESASDSTIRLTHSDCITPWEVELYADFGNVFDSDFPTWWQGHYQLFADDVSLLVSVQHGGDKQGDLAGLYIGEALDRLTLGEMARRAWLHFGDDTSVVIKHKVQNAKYRTRMRYVLPNLQTQLDVWDMKQANPEFDDSEIADALALPIDESVNGETVAELRAMDLAFRDVENALRRRKALTVQRHYRIAKQYIRNVLLGEFPLREKR